MAHTNKQEQLALILARRVLQALVSQEKLVALPENVRNQAADVLRHYPTNAKIDLLYQNVRKAQ